MKKIVKGNGSQQARQYRSCLLAVGKYIDRSACLTYNGRQGDLLVQTL